MPAEAGRCIDLQHQLGELDKGDVGIDPSCELFDIIGDGLLQAGQAQFAIAQGDIRQRFGGQLIVDGSCQGSRHREQFSNEGRAHDIASIRHHTESIV